MPRQLSFTSACQFLLAAWPHSTAASALNDAEDIAHCRQLLEHLANCQVADRPHRVEPRVLKRRKHGYPLMQLPRHTLREQLFSGKSKK